MIASADLARRILLTAGAMLGLMSAPAWAADAAAVHGRALVLDSHVDVLLPGTNARYYAPDGRSFTELDKLKAGGVDALVYAVAVSTGPDTPETSARPVETKPPPSACQRLLASSANQRSGSHTRIGIRPSPIPAHSPTTR